MLNKLFLSFSMLFIVASLCFSQTNFQYGILNVFTDLPESEIYVDGLLVGRESIVKLPLALGAHYVQVKINDSVIYAEKVEVSNNRSTTVVSDHFVDIITKTPSRGAIDREAVRLRESRGDFALGLVATSLPLYASSVKWFPMPFMGVQLLASGAIQGSGQEGFLGGRVYLSPPQKIFQDDLLTGGVFAGAGVYQLEGDIAAGIKHSYVEAGISVEMKLDDIANTLFKTKYLFVHSGSSTEDFFWDVVVLGIMNAAYLGIDVAIQKEYNGPIETFFGMGFHIYF